MAFRSCVACKARRPTDELIRLGLVSRRRLSPDLRGKIPGRGAWVCPTQACLEQVEARPRVLGRALKQDPGPEAARGLLAATRESLMAEVISRVELAAQAGALVSGTGHIEAAEGALVALVCASDASALSRARALARCDGAAVAEIPLDRVALGRLIGRGPRAALAVRAGTPGDALASRLRWLCALG